jgi:hypothetical protein
MHNQMAATVDACCERRQISARRPLRHLAARIKRRTMTFATKRFPSHGIESATTMRANRRQHKQPLPVAHHEKPFASKLLVHPLALKLRNRTRVNVARRRRRRRFARALAPTRQSRSQNHKLPATQFHISARSPPIQNSKTRLVIMPQSSSSRAPSSIGKT